LETTAGRAGLKGHFLSRPAGYFVAMRAGAGEGFGGQLAQRGPDFAWREPVLPGVMTCQPSRMNDSH